jgi:hypothetical protein
VSVLTYCHRCEGLKPRPHKHRVKDTRPSAAKRGYGKQHQEDRRLYLLYFPICQWEEGCLERATQLDHIDGNPENRDWGNYRGYCMSHHAKRTARDQPGGFRLS